MAVVTTNQNIHLYVAENYKTDKLTTKSEKGDVYVGKNKEGKKYIQVKGEDTILRSALIDPKCLLSAEIAKAESLRRPLKKVTVELTEDAVNEDGNLLAGQDYVMHIIVRQFHAVSDEYSLIKTAGVHATSKMDKKKFFQKLALSLWLNFSRELSKLVTFSLGDKIVAGVKVEDGIQVPVDADGATIEGDEKLVITEIPQDWMLGTMQQTPVFFEVKPTTVYSEGDEVFWAKVTDNTPTKKADGTWSETLKVDGADANAVGNGKAIADIEYFALGERGDQYRMVGWPNYIPTKYSVDPEKEYNTLNIHHAFVDRNEGVQKSEQEIMIVAETEATLTSILTALKAE